MLPIPAPATIEILKNVPVIHGNVNTELTTPTGAGIIKYLVNEFSEMPEMEIEKIGYGAGTKELEIPNFLESIWEKSKKNIHIQIKSHHLKRTSTTALQNRSDI